MDFIYTHYIFEGHNGEMAGKKHPPHFLVLDSLRKILNFRLRWSKRVLEISYFRARSYGEGKEKASSVPKTAICFIYYGFIAQEGHGPRVDIFNLKLNF